MVAVMVEALSAPLAVFFWAALMAGPAMLLAKKRGRRPILWGAASLAAPVVAIIILLIVGRPKTAAPAT